MRFSDGNFAVSLSTQTLIIYIFVSSNNKFAVLLSTQTLRIYIFVSSDNKIAYPSQRLQLFAECPNPEGLHPCIRLLSRSPRPQRGRTSQNQQNCKEKVQLLCRVPKAGGFASLYQVVISQYSTPAGSHLFINQHHTPRPQRGRTSQNQQNCKEKVQLLCRVPKAGGFASLYQAAISQSSTPAGSHLFINQHHIPRPQRGRISRHQKNGKQKNEVDIVIPGCAFGLRDKRPNPKEINTLINEIYLNDMATKTKWRVCG